MMSPGALATSAGTGQTALRRRVRRLSHWFPVSSGADVQDLGVGGRVDQPLLAFTLTDPDVQLCRVAQPLLAFAPTDPIVRRYRNGLFRTDLRRMTHLCHA